jgi:hypothetical protein
MNVPFLWCEIIFTATTDGKLISYQFESARQSHCAVVLFRTGGNCGGSSYSRDVLARVGRSGSSAVAHLMYSQEPGSTTGSSLALGGLLDPGVVCHLSP